MVKYICSFKDGREVKGNLLIEAIQVSSDTFNVEIWDVNTPYHCLSMFEDDKKSLISEYTQEINELKKLLTNNKEKDSAIKEKIEYFQKYINDLNKFKNKRYRYSKEDFENTFEILSKITRCKYETLEDFKEDYPMFFGRMSKEEQEAYFNKKLKGRERYKREKV